jgi:DNA modification methylase
MNVDDLKIQIAYLLVDDLLPYARNPRKNDHAVAKGAAFINEFGFLVPVLIKTDMTVIDGHLRLKCAKKLKMKTVPTITIDHLSDVQIKALRLSINRFSELADWDEDYLKVELEELDNLQYDISSLDFPNIDITNQDGGTDGLTDPDKVPDVPQNVFGVNRGDVWILGNHRLMCGDSTSEDDVKKLMDGQKADMVFTSPPYNAATKVGDGDIFNGKKTKKLYSNNGYSDDLKSNDYIKFAKSVLDMCFLFTEGFIFWNVSYNANSRFEYISQITHKLPNLLEQICWKKSSKIPFKGSLMRDWEPIYLFSTDGRKLGLDNVVSNHWTINNTDSQQNDHKACFPVALPEKAILLVKKTSGIVLEPFCGSGTSIIAAEKTGRTCYGMELDEHYISIVIKRWQDFTGKTAIKEV